MYNSRILTGIIILLVIGSCATVKAPRGSVPSRKELYRDAFGGYITLAVRDIDSMRFISGELIAIQPDAIVTMPGDSAITLPLTMIDSARIIFFNTQADGFALWTGLLMLGTVTNGAFAIGTLPLAAITGIVTSSTEAKRINYIDYPQKSWDDFRKYARFPQGLPPGINLKALTPRPSVK